MENHIDFVETELHIQHTPTKTKYSLTPYCRNTLKDYITTASFIQRTINKNDLSYIKSHQNIIIILQTPTKWLFLHHNDLLKKNKYG